MNVARETSDELSGIHGESHRPSGEGSTFDAPSSEDGSPEDGKEIAFVEFPTHLRSARGEAVAKAQLVFGDGRFNGVKKQVACPVDVAYQDGVFSGLIVTHMHGGLSLSRYLAFSEHTWRDRRRVACNLCVLVCVASQCGVHLGRLSPERVFVEPEAGRVFLTTDWASLVQKSGALQQRCLAPLPWQTEIDLAVCLYALLRRRPNSFGAELWGDDCSGLEGPAASEMVAATFDAVQKPRFAELIARFGRNTHLLRKLWDVPRPFRDMLERGLHCVDGGNVGVFAYEMVALFERKESRQRGHFSVWKDRARQFLDGARVSADQVKALERRPWGLRGCGSPAMFWAATLGLAAALGVCSAMNGFAPLNLLIVALRSADYPYFAINMGWRYTAAAALGCVTYNLFFARKHHFTGYERKSYSWSVAMAVLFMGIVQFLGAVALQGGAL